MAKKETPKAAGIIKDTLKGFPEGNRGAPMGKAKRPPYVPTEAGRKMPKAAEPPPPNDAMLNKIASEVAIPEDPAFIERQAAKEAARAAQMGGRNFDLPGEGANFRGLNEAYQPGPYRPMGAAVPAAVALSPAAAAALVGGMMIPRSTGKPKEEDYLGLINSQQRVLGGGPQSSDEMGALVQEAMNQGNPAPDAELYQGIVSPGSENDYQGNLGMAGGAPAISDAELSRMIRESGAMARQRAMQPQKSANPYLNSGSPGMRNDFNANDALMEKIMRDEMQKKFR